MLEKLFPGWTAAQLFEHCDPQADSTDPGPAQIAQLFDLIDTGLSEPGLAPPQWGAAHPPSAARADESRLAREIGAHLAYLRELLGERTPLDAYVRATQGCLAAGWPGEYAERRCALARTGLEAHGIGWGPGTERDLEQAEDVIDVAEAAGAIRTAATELEPAVRAAAGTDATFDLSIQTVDQDVYWSYRHPPGPAAS